MSGINRFFVSTRGMDRASGEWQTIQGDVILASDYDRDTQALRAEIDRYIQEGIKIADQRDALRAQIEVMRAAPANERAAAFEACPESNCDWGAFYRGWMARAAMQAEQ